MIRLQILALLVISLPACSFFDSAEDLLGKPEVVIQTDRTAYDARLITEHPARVVIDIPYQIHNPTNHPLYLIGCQTPPPPILEKRVDGEWRTAYAAVVPLCLSPPFEIAPGAVRHDTLRVRGHLPGQNIAPTFDTEIEGTYRLRTEIFASLTDESAPVGRDRLPDEQQVSNTFDVR